MKKFFDLKFRFFGLKRHLQWSLQTYLGLGFRRLLEGQKFFFSKFRVFCDFFFSIFGTIIDLSLAGIGLVLPNRVHMLGDPLRCDLGPIWGQGGP